ncbi:DNA repair protein RecN [Planctomycetales bacterium ZRK34]|nr:DNA repair protein RecN [Planctomycetales bacterium ZRK34]
MLRELHIQNLAVIEDVAVDLRRGLNCFTGQTGAGKSLIIGAFEMLLGLRSTADLLRAGADSGRVSGVFELHDADTIQRVSEAADLEMDPQEIPQQLLITRKLFASGRTSVSINGQPATAPMLRAVGELLVDVHGQHDHQYLLKPANQLLMLDRFGECDDLRRQFGDLHRRLQQLRARRAELAASSTLRRQQLELYEFQATEIDDAEPTAGEYEEVAARHRLLSNLQKVYADAGSAYGALYESEGAILEQVQQVVGILRELADLDEAMAPVAASASDGMAVLQDAALELSRYINRIDLDPAELAEVTERLNTLNRLIHKYGNTSLDEVIEYRREIQVEIERLRGESDDLDSIDQQIAPVEAELHEVGATLTGRRRAAADELCPRVEAELGELGMSGAKFTVEFGAQESDEAAFGGGATGFDAVELLVQANPGQPARPLRKVASGGELSRIMLAIKSIAAAADQVSVLVFDEIDSNVGGRMGTVIGDKLRHLAAGHQVLCITHLPQIAAYADHHLRIRKVVDGRQTRTQVEALTDQSPRVDELAEMLTGKDATDTTRRQAREMLSRAAASRVQITTRPGDPDGSSKKRSRRRTGGKRRAAAMEK